MLNPFSGFLGRCILGAGVVGALVAGLWRAAPRLGWSSQTLLLVSAVLLGASVLFFGVAVARRRRRRARATKLLARSQPVSTGTFTVPAPALILGERLERTIQWLRKSKLARAGRDIVYDLPWYLFIGPQGAGKSSLIVQSDFAFSYTEPKKPTGRLSVSPTEECDVWVTNDAVFLDPPGRCVNEGHPLKSWRASLGQIKQQRNKKPIDGIVLVLDVVELLGLDRDATRDRAERLRGLLDAAMDELQMVVPVYLVFHKCDRILGFEEFCGTLGGDDEVPLGITFDKEQYESQHPEKQFELEFDRIHQALVSHRAASLLSATGPQRNRVFAFPRQFALMKDRLSELIEVLFQLNQFLERPLLRGTYFTSAVQGGESLDLAGKLLNAKTGLPPAGGTEAAPGTTSRFINPLLARVIYPDRHLAGVSWEVRRRRLLLRMAAAGLVGVVLPLVLLFLAWGAYRDSKALIRSAEVGERTAVRDGKTAENVGALDGVKTSLETFDCVGQVPRCRIHGRRLRWGLYPGQAAHDRAREVYVERVKGLFLDPLINGDVTLGHTYDGLKTQLQAMVDAAADGDHASGEIGEFDPSRAYTLLKSLLMLSVESKADPPFLEGQLGAYWVQGVREADQPVARELMRFYLHQLGDHNDQAYRWPRSLAEDELVRSVRERLLSVGPDRYYYGILREEGADRLNSVRLAGVLEGHHPELFDAGMEVDGTFTKTGWDTLVKDRIGQMKTDYEQERSWILGVSEIQGNQAPIDELLTSYYFRDYEESWWDFVRNVRVLGFANANTASDRLAILSDAQQSPFTTLLGAVAANTWGGARGGIPGAMDKVERALGGEAEERIGVAFQSIHRFVVPGEKETSPLSEYLTCLGRLQVVVRSYLDANRPQGQEDGIRQEAEQALQVTNGLLQSFDLKSRAAVESLLKQPIRHVLAVFRPAVPDKRLRVAGVAREKKKPLDGATVFLLRAYQDNQFQADKEIARAQATKGEFAFSGPVDAGGFKLCVTKKGKKDHYCGDVRLGADTDGSTYELKRPKSKLIFGGGKVEVTLRIGFVTR